MDGDGAFLEEAPPDPLRVAPAVQACAAGVGHRVRGFDPEGVVELEKFVGDGFHGGPEAVAVRAVADGSGGDS